MFLDVYVNEEDFEILLNYIKLVGKDSGICKIDVRYFCILLWFY